MLQKLTDLRDDWRIFRRLRQQAARWKISARKLANENARLKQQLAEATSLYERRIDSLQAARDDANNLADGRAAEIGTLKITIDGLLANITMRQSIDERETAINHAKKVRAGIEAIQSDYDRE